MRHAIGRGLQRAIQHAVRHAAGAALLGAAALASAATPPPQYELTLLGTFGRDWSVARGISENGKVVGYGFDTDGQSPATNYLSFLYDQGVGVELPMLPGLPYTTMQGVNDSGVAVGRAFRLVDNGFGPVLDGLTIRAVSVQSGAIANLGGLRSQASAINNAGLIAGRSRFNGANHAALFDGGQLVDLGILAGGFTSSASAINDLGEAVGSAARPDFSTTAALFRQGQVTDLAVGIDTSFANALGINNRGQAVGYIQNPDGSGAGTAYLFDNGRAIDLGTLGGVVFAEATDINNAGWVVGMAVRDDQLQDIPFLRIDGGLIDLNTLITPASRGGWLMSDAYAINDRGQIVGTAIRDGQLVAALLTPVPELPATALLLLGLTALGAVRRGRR